MPTRKQKRRSEKERRHEYETVWVDGEGNELEEPPDEDVQPSRDKRANGKPQPKGQQRGARQTRTPLPPSWRRAARRALIMGGFIFVVIYLINGKSTSGHRLETALIFGILYTGLFVPFTYYLDRWTYNRFQRRAEQAGKGAPKKR